jgi:hypothetical protein
MRTTVASMFAVVTFASFVSADDFTLKNTAGETFGPFPIKEGAAIRLDDANYKIASITNTAEQRLRRKLESIVIPEINFKAAPMEEVVDFLRKAAKKNDPAGEGVNIAFTSSPCGFATNAPPTGQSNIVTSVTLSARQITLLEALKVACNAADFRFVLRRNSLLIVHKDAPDGEFRRRVYAVLHSLLQRGIEMAATTSSDNTDDRNDLKATFAGFGVSWPKGSSIQHLPQIGKLVVVNTEENLAVFDKILAVLNLSPSQIRLEFFFVAFPTAMVARAESGRHFTSEDALKLWKNGKGRPVSTVHIVTKSASEATSKDVSEFIYPTEFTQTHLNTSTNSEVRFGPGVVEPGGFETREVGAIVSVMPEVTPDGQMIDLTFTPQYVEDPTWENYDVMIATNSMPTKAIYRQPLFTAHSISTQMSIHCGIPIVIAGGWHLRQTPEIMYIILKADMVGPDGKVLPGANPAAVQFDPL